MTTSFGNCLLRFAEPPGPDASPREARNVRMLTAATPGRPTRINSSLMPPTFRVRPHPVCSCSPPAEAQRAPTSCSPPRGGAANCATQRVARAMPKARPKARPNLSPKFQPHARPDAAQKPIAVFEPKELSQPQAQPNSPPRVRLTAAPLSLPAFPSPAAILAGLAKRQPAEYTFLSGRATDFVCDQVFSRALRDSSIFGSPPK